MRVSSFQCSVLSLLIALPSAWAVRDGHVDAELISDAPAITPGTSFWAGVRLRMDPGWHTYWLNPGDTGLGTTIEWTLPDGVAAGPIQWPCPEKIEAPPSLSYGYFGDVTLLVEMTASSDVKSDVATAIGCRVKWLVCHDICVGGSANLSKDFRTRAGAEPLADARARLPKDANDWNLKASFADNKYILSLVRPASFTDTIHDVYFFASDPELLDHAAAQPRVENENESRILLARSPYESAPVERLQGILCLNNDPRSAIAVDVPVEK